MKLIEELKANYYKKGTKEIEPIKVIISIVSVIVLVIFYFYITNDVKSKEAERKKYLRYTVGSTVRRYKNPKSSQPTVEFVFFYNLVRYSNREHIDAAYEGLDVIDKRYYVEFSYKNPKNSKLLLMYPVPDSIQGVPDDGWEHMPGFKK